MKKLLIAFAFILFAQSAWAQGNPTCPTRPFGDNTNACASTAFVQAAIVGACTATGAFEVGTGASSVCTSDPTATAIVPGTFYVGNGPLASIGSSPYQFLVNGGATAAALLSMQKGISGTLYTPGSSTNILALQTLIDTGTGLNQNFVGLVIDARIQAGTNGSVGAISALATSELANTQAGATGGATALLGIAKCAVGGDCFGGNSYAWGITTVPRNVISWEFDIDNRTSGATVELGAQFVKVATSTGVVVGAGSESSAIKFVNQVGASGWRDYGIVFGQASGVGFPLATGATVLKVYSGTVAAGIDFSGTTFSGGRWAITGNNAALGSFNAAGSVIQSLVNLDASNVLQLYNSLVGVTSAGFVKVNQNVAAAPSISSTGGIEISLIDSGAGGFDVFSYNAQPNNHLARANGTGATPTKVVNTNNLGAYFYGGFHGGSAWVLNTAGEQAVAAEDWNDATHLGTHLKFLTTPTATGANAEAGRFSSSGGLSVGTTTDAGLGNALILNNVTIATAGKTLVLKQGVNGSVGTFVCTAAGTITISNTNVAISDAIIISLNLVGGTPLAPIMKTITAATSFTVLCGGADTSTYNYAIIKNAAWLLPSANDNEPFSWANKAFA